MRSQGNALPIVCAQNICSTVRGEVAYNQRLGLDPALIDTPAEAAMPRIRDEVAAQLEAFEPRIDPQTINIQVAPSGDGSVGVYIMEVSA